MELFRVLDPEEEIRKGDKAILADGKAVLVDGWPNYFRTAKQLCDASPKSNGESVKVIRVERAKEFDLDYILAGLEKVRKELWSEY